MKLRIAIPFSIVLLFLTMMLTHYSVSAQTHGTLDCVGGNIGLPATIFPCEDISLEAILPTNFIFSESSLALPGTGADLWGWTDDMDTPDDKSDDREYAIVGNSIQTSFVDVTTPESPELLAILPAPNTLDNALWRDVKTLGHYALIVGDFNILNTHGVQIFDLHKLRPLEADGVVLTFTTFDPDTDAITYLGTEDHPIDTAHNIVTNEDTGFAYAVGAGSCSGGLHTIDMSNPLNPVFAGCFDEDGYTHDAQCVVYHGPDEDYVGDEICMNANEDFLTVVNMTDKSAPVMLDTETYPTVGYTHQGWLTEDHAYFILGDETDETDGAVENTTSYIWDVRDLDAIELIGIHSHETLSTDHNLYVKDGLVYMANYTQGVRILDLTEISEGRLTEVAYFDASPGRDEPATSGGTWSVYPYFESGTIVINELEKGLIVLRPVIPNFKLTQDVTLSSRAAPQPGETVEYTAVVTNTGTAAGTEMAVVIEVNGVDYPMSGPTTLAEGASAEYTYTYTVLESDCDMLSAHARMMSAEDIGRRVDLPLETAVCNSTVPLTVGLSSSNITQSVSPMLLIVAVLFGATGAFYLLKVR